MKFTFKTNKPTGKWRSFESTSHDVKLNKVEVGTIDDNPPYKVRLRVLKTDINEDGNPNCPWKWIRLKKENESVQAAKVWLNEVIESILLKYKFPND